MSAELTLVTHARGRVPLVHRVGEVLTVVAILLLSELRLRLLSSHLHILVHGHLCPRARLFGREEVGLLEARLLYSSVLKGARNLQKKRGLAAETGWLEEERRRGCTLVRLADDCSSSSRERFCMGELYMVTCG